MSSSVELPLGEQDPASQPSLALLSTGNQPSTEARNVITISYRLSSTPPPPELAILSRTDELSASDPCACSSQALKCWWASLWRPCERPDVSSVVTESGEGRTGRGEVEELDGSVGRPGGGEKG